MGILSNLFKVRTAETRAAEPKPERAAKRADRPDPPSPEVSERHPDLPEKADPAAPAQQPLRSISFGGAKSPSAPNPASAAPRKTIAPAPPPAVRATVRKPVTGRPATVPDKSVTVTLQEVLAQIPPQLLRTDCPDAGKTVLNFKVSELLPFLSKGKATVPLLRVVALSPGVFTDQRPDGDLHIELPLQKIVSQIDKFPGRAGQMEDEYPPLDPQYESLIVEKGAPAIASALEELDALIGAPAPAPEIPVPVATKFDPIPEIATEPAAQTPEPVAAPEPAPIPEAAVPAMPEPEVTPESMLIPEPVSEAIPSPGPVEIPAAIEEQLEEPPLEEIEALLPEPELPQEEEKVSYGLAALLPNVPKSWLNGDQPPSIGDEARITVPFHWIEPQLSAGKVELAHHEFLAALPEEFKAHFSSANDEAGAAKIQIPLNEVFLNLPGVEPLPPLPKPAARVEVEPEPVAEPEPEAAATAEPVAEAKEEEAKVAAHIADPWPSAEELPAPAEAAEPAAPQASPTPAPSIELEDLVLNELLSAPKAATTAEPILETKEEKAETSDADFHPYVEPAAASIHLAPPKIQLQQFAPPPINTAPLPISEQEETAASLPESRKVLAFPGAPPPPDSLRESFITGDKLDAVKVAAHVAAMPGVTAAILTVQNETQTAGPIPANFKVDDIGKAATILFQSMESQAAQSAQEGARNITLHHEEFSSTYFKQGPVLLGILHPPRFLDAAQHNQLAFVTAEVARLS